MKYWLGNYSVTTLTAAQCEGLAIFARGLTTGASTNLGARAAQVLNTTGAGQVLVSRVRVSSAAADVTAILSVEIEPTSRVLVSTALASSNGVVCNMAGNTGYLGILVNTTGGTPIKRYILLFSS
jgi:hypothetical protein